MRKSTAAIAILIVAAVWFGFQVSQPSAAEKPAPVAEKAAAVFQKWEYALVSLPRDSQEVAANKFGGKGWEMCGVTQINNNSTTLWAFKRPKQ